MAISTTDKKRIIDILAAAFEQNKSVSYITGRGNRRGEKIRLLMEYAYQVCESYGKVVLSADKNACALVLFPHTKKFSLRSAYWDLKLVFGVIGPLNLPKILRRERLIAARHPPGPLYYLWFIGVDTAVMGRGIGTALLAQLVEDSRIGGLPFYLETSTEENLSWYKRFGFRIFYELDITYHLFFLRFPPAENAGELPGS